MPPCWRAPGPPLVPWSGLADKERRCVCTLVPGAFGPLPARARCPRFRLFFLCFSPPPRSPPSAARGRPCRAGLVAASTRGGRPLPCPPACRLVVVVRWLVVFGVVGGVGCCWWFWLGLVFGVSCSSCGIACCLLVWCGVCAVWWWCFALCLPRFGYGRPLARVCCFSPWHVPRRGDQFLTAEPPCAARTI